jgi:hypothetical protein
VISSGVRLVSHYFSVARKWKDTAGHRKRNKNVLVEAIHQLAWRIHQTSRVHSVLDMRLRISSFDTESLGVGCGYVCLV